MIEPRSFENSKFKDLIKVLIEWVNDELHHYRIIVQDIEEDLYDGQVSTDFLECIERAMAKKISVRKGTAEFFSRTLYTRFFKELHGLG